MSEPDDAASEDRDRQYAEVSLRAVELLARAQRTADEAVAEAQAYARDLEASARAQYAEILHRAQVAARDLQRAGGAGATPESSDGGPASPALVEQVDYVRTYARVAHAQLKTVLTALTDELDNLAAVAAGRAPGEEFLASHGLSAPPRLRDARQEESGAAEPERSGDERDASPPGESPEGSDDESADAQATDDAPAPATGDGSDEDRVWPPIFHEQEAGEPSQPSTWRNSFQRR